VSVKQPIYDISNFKDVYFAFRTIGGIAGAHMRFQARRRDATSLDDIPFPLNTCGVFYYHVDPQLPPMNGSVRFRLCDSLENFVQGKDLEVNIGKPWMVPLVRLAHVSSFRALNRFIIEEGLVDKQLMRDIQKLKMPRRPSALFLYQLSQSFVVDLHMTVLILHLVTRTTMSTVQVTGAFFLRCRPFAGRSSRSTNSKYVINNIAGLARVRFELSTLPEHDGQGPTLILRILEFLTPLQTLAPVGYGPVILPDPGKLLMRRTPRGKLKTWSYPLNRRREGTLWKEFITASNS